jgi:acyl carrier protein
MDIERQVKEIISTTLGVPVNVITRDLESGDIVEWDSVGNLAVISAIQDEMEVEIPMEDYFDLTSVAAIIKEVEKLKE